MPKKQQPEPKITSITPSGDRFIVTMSREEADKYPMLAYHAIDDVVYQITAHMVSGENIDVQFTKA